MRIRGIDENHDWTFGSGKEVYLVDEAAILQNAKTKLLEFFNDCFFNMNAGIDWIGLMRRKNTKNQIALSCRAVLLQVDGVNEVNNVSVSLVAGRGLSLTYTINTIFSRGVISQIEVINV